MMPESSLRTWLGIVAAGSLVSLLQVMVWPRWPSASLPSTYGLLLTGFTLTSKDGFEGSQRSHLAMSPIHRYRITPEDAEANAASPLELLQIAMLSPRRLGDFQLAVATKDQPSLKMSNRRLQRLGDDELAIGSIKNNTSLQTCLTAAGPAAVSKEAFSALDQPPANAGEQLERVLGLRPNRRTDCVLLTLSSSDSKQKSVESLIGIYKQLRPQLKLLINP